MRKSLLLAIVLFLSSEAWSQQPVPQGFLNYTVRTTGTNNLNNSFTRVQKQSFFFDDTTLRYTRSPRPEVFISAIKKCGVETGFFYATDGRKRYYFEDKQSSLFFDLGMYNSQTPTILYSDDTVSVKNFACKKASLLFSFDNAVDTMEVYYLPEYKIKADCFPSVFRELNGLPVYFKFRERPLVVIGNPKYPSITEFRLDDWGDKNPVAVDSIENKSAYKLLKQNEIVPTIVQLANPNIKMKGAREERIKWQ